MIPLWLFILFVIGLLYLLDLILAILGAIFGLLFGIFLAITWNQPWNQALRKWPRRFSEVGLQRIWAWVDGYGFPFTRANSARAYYIFGDTRDWANSSSWLTIQFEKEDKAWALKRAADLGYVPKHP